MNDPRKEIDMGFTKDCFPEGTHMCLIYDDDEQRKRVIGQFLAKGILLGEKAAYFTDATNSEEVEGWLREFGAIAPAQENRGEYETQEAVVAYCPDGEFVPTEMIARLLGFCSCAIDAGFAGLRVSGEASWALRGIPGSEKLLEYEAMVNTAIKGRPIIPICQYDSRRFDGATLLNVLRVHPLMIVREIIVHNPYYVAPEEFLRERGITMHAENPALADSVR